MNGSSVAYMTGPAMAPGAIAYGAVAVPFYGQPQLPSGGMGVPGVATTPTRLPEPRAVTVSYQNVEVLGALTKLTGEDFGYDEAAWRRWLRASFNPNPKAARQVRQP